MLYAGLDLSRQRLDVHVLDEAGRSIEVTAVRPDADALRTLVARVGAGQSVTAVIESMNGARFVHDQLELAGWEVAIADAQRVRGLAPLAAKTDKIDAWLLAELGRRDLVPEIWLPSPGVREERELARFRLHLVHHRASLKNRIHATLIAFGHQVPVTDLFGVKGRVLLEDFALPLAWRSGVDASLRLIEQLEGEVARVETELKSRGLDHRYLPLLRTLPGVGLVLGFTIASEIGDIGRFTTPKKLVGYTGLVPTVYQSGERDRRGALSKAGPAPLRWALIEASTNACRHPAFAARYQRTRQRLGRQRGSSIARVELARELATAIWHMLTKNQPFRPAGPA